MKTVKGVKVGDTIITRRYKNLKPRLRGKEAKVLKIEKWNGYDFKYKVEFTKANVMGVKIFNIFKTDILRNKTRKTEYIDHTPNRDLRKTDKERVQKEILALLDEGIDNEMEAMKDFYTLAEIAREVLLALDKKEFVK